MDPENIHTSPMEVFFCLNPLLLEFPIKPHTFPYKFWLLSPPSPPPPLIISNDLPWGECGYFLEPHNKGGRKGPEGGGGGGGKVVKGWLSE